MPAARASRSTSARAGASASAGGRSSADPVRAAAITLVSGPEDLLADRAVASVVAAVREREADTEVHQLSGSGLTPGFLATLVSPSLFGGGKVVVVRDAQDIPSAVHPEVKAYFAEPFEDTAVVLVHPGGAKGKGILDAARAAGAQEIACPKLSSPKDRLGFVRNEFRTLGRSIAEDAAHALLDALGGDLRELASACNQLAADIEGPISAEAVSRYYRGRADTTSFAVADLTVEGRTAAALEALRWAVSVGVAPVLITSALSQGLRNIARLKSAPRTMRPADIARDLGMPPWKVDRVRQQVRGWTDEGITAAVRAVAEADAAVKGAGADPAYALERAVLTVARCRGGR